MLCVKEMLPSFLKNTLINVIKIGEHINTKITCQNDNRHIKNFNIYDKSKANTMLSEHFPSISCSVYSSTYDLLISLLGLAGLVFIVVVSSQKIHVVSLIFFIFSNFYFICFKIEPSLFLSFSDYNIDHLFF